MAEQRRQRARVRGEQLTPAEVREFRRALQELQWQQAVEELQLLQQRQEQQVQMDLARQLIGNPHSTSQPADTSPTKAGKSPRTCWTLTATLKKWWERLRIK